MPYELPIIYSSTSRALVSDILWYILPNIVTEYVVVILPVQLKPQVWLNQIKEQLSPVFHLPDCSIYIYIY